MSDRLHEIIGEIGVFHNQLLENKNSKMANDLKTIDILIQQYQSLCSKNQYATLKYLLVLLLIHFLLLGSSLWRCRFSLFLIEEDVYLCGCHEDSNCQHYQDRE